LATSPTTSNASAHSVPSAAVARLCLLAVLVLWVSFILIARGSAKGSLTPPDIAWLRFVFSGLVVLPLAWIHRAALIEGLSHLQGPARIPGSARETSTASDFVGGPSRSLARGLVLGLVGGIGYCAFAYSGFFLAPAAHGAVLLPGTLPLWTALISIALLAERLTAARVVGLALIIAGGLAVGGASLVSSNSAAAGVWRGDLLFVVASMTWALYGVLCRRWRVGALEATAAIALSCFVLVVPAYGVAVWGGWVRSGLAAAPWGEIALQAVFQGGLAMLVAGFAFTQVVSRYGPVRTTMATAIVPPLAALMAVPVLGEPLAASALVGLVCVTVGLLVGTGVIRWPARVVSTPPAPSPGAGSEAAR
jgi:drug/metabolite transporter (DMT)-like permease